MKQPSAKRDLLSIAERLPDSASYADAMYELYVCMKVARGRKAAEEGRTVTHEQVKQKFTKK